MNYNSDMINLVKLVEGKDQKFAGEEVGQKPGDQVRGTDKATAKGTDHPFKGRLVGEESEQGVAEGNDEKIADRYDQDEWDEKMRRLKKLAGQGPLKTVWDPVKRVYKNVPVNQKPEDR